MVFLILCIVFYSGAALFYRHANHLHCNRLAIIVSERISAVILMSLYMLFFDTFNITSGATLLAFAGGITIFISRLALLTSLKYGKISSSWTAVNLSLVIPILASMIFWKEIPNLRQTIGLLMVPLAIILLQEEPGEK